MREADAFNPEISVDARGRLDAFVMRILRLHLRRKWWDQIRDGKKTVELRRATDYWRKRLIGREYDEIYLCLGYPKAGDESHILRRKWRLVAKEVVLHEEFGSKPIEVFVIDVACAA